MSKPEPPTAAPTRGNGAAWSLGGFALLLLSFSVSFFGYYQSSQLRLTEAVTEAKQWEQLAHKNGDALEAAKRLMATCKL